VYGVFIIVLVYDIEISSRDFNEIIEVEVAMLVRGFNPRDHSEKIDEAMVKGPGKGLNSNLINISIDKLPLAQF
jgi:hypothetical protein